jgi:hypothetical protein
VIAGLVAEADSQRLELPTWLTGCRRLPLVATERDRSSCQVEPGQWPRCGSPTSTFRLENRFWRLLAGWVQETDNLIRPRDVQSDDYMAMGKRP